MSPNYSERPPTDEEQQRLSHLSDICFKGFGIRLLSASVRLESFLLVKMATKYNLPTSRHL